MKTVRKSLLLVVSILMCMLFGMSALAYDGQRYGDSLSDYLTKDSTISDFRVAKVGSSFSIGSAYSEILNVWDEGGCITYTSAGRVTARKPGMVLLYVKLKKNSNIVGILLNVYSSAEMKSGIPAMTIKKDGRSHKLPEAGYVPKFCRVVYTSSNPSVVSVTNSSYVDYKGYKGSFVTGKKSGTVTLTGKMYFGRKYIKTIKRKVTCGTSVSPRIVSVTATKTSKCKLSIGKLGLSKSMFSVKAKMSNGSTKTITNYKLYYQSYPKKAGTYKVVIEVPGYSKKVYVSVVVGGSVKKVS